MANQITPAEVLEVIYEDTNPNLIYGLKVKEFGGTPAGDVNSLAAITAKPLNTSYIRVPVVGEVVLILKAPSSFSSGTRDTLDTYYIDIVSMQSSIHHNGLPTATNKTITTSKASGNSANYNESASGNTQKASSPKLDPNFTEEVSIKPMQPYIGDVLMTGRYGNSIRFSTTPKSGKFTVKQKWSAGDPAAPITIIRNSKTTTGAGKVNNFITEDFKKDDNLIVMASGQLIEFENSSKVLSSNSKYALDSWKKENWGKTPQTLITSGRIIFNSTQKEIMAFAKNGIGLSSETAITIDAKNMISLNAKKMELGTSSDQQLILGNKWQEWMEKLIDAIGALTDISPVGPCIPTKSDPQWGAIETLKGQIPTLLSDISFTKKS
jgi:hypothetical protein